MSSSVTREREEGRERKEGAAVRVVAKMSCRISGISVRVKFTQGPMRARVALGRLEVPSCARRVVSPLPSSPGLVQQDFFAPGPVQFRTHELLAGVITRGRETGVVEHHAHDGHPICVRHLVFPRGAGASKREPLRFNAFFLL